MGVHNCGRGCRVRGSGRGVLGGWHLEPRVRGIVRMGDKVQKLQAGQGGSMKGRPPPTAWPDLGSEGPSPQRPHPQARLTCSLPACGWDLWALSAVPNVTGFSPPKTPSVPSPSQPLPPPPFLWGKGGLESRCWAREAKWQGPGPLTGAPWGEGHSGQLPRPLAVS